LSNRGGRLGVCICYDLEFPEVRARARRCAGAELRVRAATNWPDEGRPDGERPMEVVRAMAAASSNRVFIAASVRCGMRARASNYGSPGSADHRSVGLSFGPARGERPAVLRASVDLAGRARQAHQLSATTCSPTGAST
jgi:predicted amidohydrolase